MYTVYFFAEELIVRMDETQKVSRTFSSENNYGYLMSPNYPDVYPDSGAFQCTFTQPSDATILSFEVLDFALQDESASSGECTDFIDIHEVTNGVIFQTRQPQCDVIERGSLVEELAGSEIRMIFHSDESLERRGFWLKFTGKPRKFSQ